MSTAQPAHLLPTYDEKLALIFRLAKRDYEKLDKGKTPPHPIWYPMSLSNLIWPRDLEFNDYVAAFGHHAGPNGTYEQLAPIAHGQILEVLTDVFHITDPIILRKHGNDGKFEGAPLTGEQIDETLYRLQGEAIVKEKASTLVVLDSQPTRDDSYEAGREYERQRLIPVALGLGDLVSLLARKQFDGQKDQATEDARALHDSVRDIMRGDDTDGD